MHKMDEIVEKCLRELADSALPMVHLVTDPTPEQRRLQIAIKAANELLAFQKTTAV